MPYPRWVRLHGAYYAGMWVAVLDDETVDCDESRDALLARLKERDYPIDYVVLVPASKR